MSNVPVSTPAGPPATPPAEASTGRLVAIVIGVVVGVILLTVAGLLIVGYIFASKFHVTTARDEQGQERTMKVETPFGRFRVQKQGVDPKLLGIPLYPGATVAKDDTSGARVDLDLDFADKSMRVLAVKMETSDPFDKVVDFYRNEAAEFALIRKSDRDVEFHWERGQLKKVVAIEQRHGNTRIALANIGEPEAN
jgi:hypothetical protein